MWAEAVRAASWILLATATVGCAGLTRLEAPVTINVQ
jgi:hypothetical protein